MSVQVTIILTVRNEAAHIARCLDSVLALDLDGIDHEILIVDGLSDDATLKTISEYEDRIRQLRVLANPTRGVAAGRNIGIREARGDVVVLMDAHARYAPDYVKRCLEVMEKTGAANVGGPAIALPGSESAMARAIALAHHSPFGLGGGQFRDPGAEGLTETVWPGCFRTEVFAKAGYIDERRSRTEDLEFNTRLRQAGFTIYLSPLIKAWYYCRTTLGETWRQRWADGYEITRFLPDNPAAPRLRHLVPLAFVSSLLLSLTLSVVFSRLYSVDTIMEFGIWDLGITALRLLVLELGLYLAASLFFTIRSACLVTRLNDNGPPMVTQSYDNEDKQSQDGRTTVTQPYDNRITMLRIVVLLPVVFVTLHFSYGLGSIWGLASLPYWAARKQKRE